MVGAAMTIRGSFVSAGAHFAIALRFRVSFNRASVGISLRRGAVCGGAEGYDYCRVSDSGRDADGIVNAAPNRFFIYA